jgi:hypothetical protein
MGLFKESAAIPSHWLCYCISHMRNVKKIWTCWQFLPNSEAKGSSSFTFDYVQIPNTLTEWSWGSSEYPSFNLSWNERIKIKVAAYDVEVSQSESFHYHALSVTASAVYPDLAVKKRGILIVSICNADFYLGFSTPKEIRFNALPMLPPTLSAAYNTTGYSRVWKTIQRFS